MPRKKDETKREPKGIKEKKIEQKKARKRKSNLVLGLGRKVERKPEKDC